MKEPPQVVRNLETLLKVGQSGEAVGKTWIRSFADALGINSFAVEGLLNLAKSGANLEQLTERWRAIRQAVTDPERLQKAGIIFSKVLEGEYPVWPKQDSRPTSHSTTRQSRLSKRWGKK